MNRQVQLGRVYRCNICGAQVLVIRAATAALDPYCCNEPMEAIEPVVPVYRCELCGSEVAVLRAGGGALDLVCCNRPMVLREAVTPEAA